MFKKKIIKITFSNRIDLHESIQCSHTNDKNHCHLTKAIDQTQMTKVTAGKHNYSFKTNHELIFEFAIEKNNLEDGTDDFEVKT